MSTIETVHDAFNGFISRNAHAASGARTFIGPQGLLPPGDGTIPEYDRISVTPLEPTIGARIGGVDIADVPGDEQLFADIELALKIWKVLVFPDQVLQPRDLASFARLWGEPITYLPRDGSTTHYRRVDNDVPEVASIGRDPEQPDVYQKDVSGGQNVWHTDGSEKEVPPRAALLYCRKIPAVGGDTLFCDMAAAYDGLPETVKSLIDGRRAIWDLGSDVNSLMKQPEGRSEYAAGLAQTSYCMDHPIVRTHPESGRRVLYCDYTTTGISGLDPAESDVLLTYLKLQARVPEYQLRVKWEPNMLVLWDETTTQHYASSDFREFGGVRVMERCEIKGNHRPY